jgi:hypothetical protein
VLYISGQPIVITGRGGPYGCETARLPQSSDNRLTDGGKLVGLRRRPAIRPSPTETSLLLNPLAGSVGPRAVVKKL